MKKISFKMPLIAIALIDLAMSAVFIAITPEEARSSAGFWIGWIFAAVIGVGVIFAMLFFVNTDRSTRYMTFRTLVPIWSVFEALYVLTFLIGVYALGGSGSGTVFTVIADIAVTVAFAVTVLVKMTGLSFLREVNEEQARVISEVKSTYIPKLLDMLTSAVAIADDDGVKASLRELADMVAASPEMSPKTAEMTERELNAIVYQIKQYVALREYGEIAGLILKAKDKLTERNGKCTATR